MENDEVIDIIKEKEMLGEITELPGEGQAACCECNNRTWCCFLYVYKGKHYCYQCLYEVIKNEYQL